MANEFVARNGLIAQDNSTISGSLTVTNGINGTITGTASYAANADLLDNRDSSTFANTGSNNFIGTQTITGSISQSGNFTTTGTITAQTLVVQVITSSQNFITGSTKFGTLLSNTHQFTGSVSASGSLAVNTNVLYADGANVGIGTTTPNAKLEVNGNIYTTSNTNFLLFGTSSAANPYIQGISDDSIAIGNKNVARLSINPSGSVGIGTTSPAARLHISNDGQYGIEIDVANEIIQAYNRTSAEYQEIKLYSSNLRFFNGTSSTITERMRITSGGNILVGTTTGHYVTTNRTVLNINGTSSSILGLQSGNTSSGYLYADANDFTVSTEGTRNLNLTTAGSAPIVFITNTTEKMRLTSGGNVGIGTTNPAYKLDVVGSFSFTTGGNYLQYNSGILYHGNYYQYPSGNDYLLYARTNGALIFGTNDTERMRITSSGSVGIGTTSPGYKLDVVGNIAANGGIFYSRNANYPQIVLTETTTNTSALMYYDDVSSPKALRFRVSGSSDLVSINSSGNVGIGTTSPNQLLHLYKSSGTIFLALQSSTNYGYFYNDGTNIGLASDIGSTGLKFIVNRNAPDSAVVINSSGNVGIGTTSPNARLHVAGTINAYPYSTDGLIYVSQAETSGGATNVQIHSNGATYFNGGNVGINTTSPVVKLHVVENGLFTNNGTDSGQSYVGTTPILTVSTDGDGTASSVYASNAVFKVGIGGGNTGNVTTEWFRVNLNGRVGIGTSAPANKLQVNTALQTEFFGTDSATPESSLTAWGTGALRGLGTGSAILFAVPANTDGSNVWAQARILGTGDNNTNGSAEGAMFLQTRALYNPGVGGSWNWRTNMVLRASGNVGVGTISPAYKLDVVGSFNLGSNAYINYTATYPYTITVANTAGVGDIVLNAGAGSSGYESKINLQGGTSGYLQFSVASSERMRITSGGNVGIGTTTANAKLEVYPGSISSDANQEVIRLDVPGSNIFSSATGYINFRGYDISNNVQRDIAWIGTQLVPDLAASNRFGGNLVFRTTNTGLSQTPQERMRIDSSGNVGIGTTSPSARLHVSGSSSAQLKIEGGEADLWLVNTGGGGSTWRILGSTGGDTKRFRIYDNDNARDVFNIYSDGNPIFPFGNVGIGTTSPGYKLEVNGSTWVSGTVYVNRGVNSTDGYIYLDHPGTQVWKQGVFNDNTSTFSIGNGGGFSRLLNITNGGNVGIGLTDPLATLATLGGAVQFMGDYRNHATIIKSAGASGTFNGSLTITIPEMSSASTDGFGGYSCEVYVSGYAGIYCHAWFSGYINAGITPGEATILRSNGGWSISQSSYGSYNQGFQFVINYPDALIHPTARIIFNKGGSTGATAYPANNITAVWS